MLSADADQLGREFKGSERLFAKAMDRDFRFPVNLGFEY